MDLQQISFINSLILNDIKSILHYTENNTSEQYSFNYHYTKDYINSLDSLITDDKDKKKYQQLFDSLFDDPLIFEDKLSPLDIYLAANNSDSKIINLLSQQPLSETSFYLLSKSKNLSELHHIKQYHHNNQCSELTWNSLLNLPYEYFLITIQNNKILQH